jgi:hypothetical protein
VTGTRRLATAAGALALAASLTGPVAAAASSPGVGVDRTIRDARISEASGLAVSLRHPGLLWTHNDSGHPGQLFAVRPDGRTAATVRVAGVPATDWEAIAGYRDAAGRSMLAVADTGDNAAARPFVEIVVLPEPPARDATVRPERVIRLRYPAGGVDAEALLVDPDGGRAFVVTKGFGGTVYEVPPDVWRGTAALPPIATFVPRAGVPLTLVTDGVMGPGGHPVLRTYGELAVLPPLDDDVTGGSLQPLAMLRLPAQRQGEGLALSGPRTALVDSEGTGQDVLRVPLPADVVALLTPPPAPSPTSTRPSPSGTTRGGAATGGTSAAAAPGATPARGESGGSSSDVGGIAAVVAGAVVGVLAVGAVGVVRRRRR